MAELDSLFVGSRPIDTIMPIRFLDGQMWLGSIGAICRKPMVAAKLKSSGIGSTANVAFDLHFGAAKGDAIAMHFDISTWHKSFARSLLEDSEDPFFRIENRIVAQLSPIHAHKGRGTEAAFDAIPPSDNPCGFIACILRAKEVESRRATNIQRSLAGIFEVAIFDGHIRRAAFGLHTG